MVIWTLGPGFSIIFSYRARANNIDCWLICTYKHKTIYFTARCIPEYNTLDYGTVDCTNSNKIDSVCTFSCQDGFKLVGIFHTICDLTPDGVGIWHNDPPVCERELKPKYNEVTSMNWQIVWKIGLFWLKKWVHLKHLWLSPYYLKEKPINQVGSFCNSILCIDRFHFSDGPKFWRVLSPCWITLKRHRVLHRSCRKQTHECVHFPLSIW